MKTKLTAEVSFSLPEIEFTSVDGNYDDRITDRITTVSVEAKSYFPAGCVILSVGYQKVLLTEDVVSLMHTFIKSQSYINEKLGVIGDFEEAEKVESDSE